MFWSVEVEEEVGVEGGGRSGTSPPNIEKNYWLQHRDLGVANLLMERAEQLLKVDCLVAVCRSWYGWFLFEVPKYTLRRGF